MAGCLGWLASAGRGSSRLAWRPWNLVSSSADRYLHASRQDCPRRSFEARRVVPTFLPDVGHSFGGTYRISSLVRRNRLPPAQWNALANRHDHGRAGLSRGDVGCNRSPEAAVQGERYDSLVHGAKLLPGGW